MLCLLRFMNLNAKIQKNVVNMTSYKKNHYLCMHILRCDERKNRCFNDKGQL